MDLKRNHGYVSVPAGALSLGIQHKETAAMSYLNEKAGALGVTLKFPVGAKPGCFVYLNPEVFKPSSIGHTGGTNFESNPFIILNDRTSTTVTYKSIALQPDSARAQPVETFKNLEMALRGALKSVQLGEVAWLSQAGGQYKVAAIVSFL